MSGVSNFYIIIGSDESAAVETAKRQWREAYAEFFDKQPDETPEVKEVRFLAADDPARWAKSMCFPDRFTVLLDTPRVI